MFPSCLAGPVCAGDCSYRPVLPDEGLPLPVPRFPLRHRALRPNLPRPLPQLLLPRLYPRETPAQGLCSERQCRAQEGAVRREGDWATWTSMERNLPQTFLCVSSWIISSRFPVLTSLFFYDSTITQHLQSQGFKDFNLMVFNSTLFVSAYPVSSWRGCVGGCWTEIPRPLSHLVGVFVCLFVYLVDWFGLFKTTFCPGST